MPMIDLDREYSGLWVGKRPCYGIVTSSGQRKWVIFTPCSERHIPV